MLFILKENALRHSKEVESSRYQQNECGGRKGRSRSGYRVIGGAIGALCVPSVHIGALTEDAEKADEENLVLGNLE